MSVIQVFRMWSQVGSITRVISRSSYGDYVYAFGNLAACELHFQSNLHQYLVSSLHSGPIPYQ